MTPIDDNPISGFKILVLFFLSLVLERFISGLLYIFMLCAAFLFYLWNSWVAHCNIKCLDAAEATCAPSVRRNARDGHYYTEIVGMPVNDASDVKLTIEDVKTMMEAHLNNNESDDLGMNAEIEGLFEEELSLDEVKEGFDLFDQNGDGFIDAGDLKKVLCSLGFTVGSEVDECRRMISVFDDDGDGRLDFEEFAKLVEQTFD